MKLDYLSFTMLSFFIIRIRIIVTIFKFIITIIINTIGVAAIVYVAVFSNFTAYKLFLVF